MDKTKATRSLSLLWERKVLHPYFSFARKTDSSGQQQPQQQAYAPLGAAIAVDGSELHTIGSSGSSPTTTFASSPTANMDMFFGRVADVQASIKAIESALKGLKALHGKSLSLTTADEGTTAMVRAEIEAVTGDLGVRSNDVRRDLAELAGMVGASSAAEANSRKAHFDRLKSDLTRVVEEWNRIESIHRDKLRDRVARQVRIVQPDATEQEVRDVIESGETQVFESAILTGSRSDEAKRALGEAQSRRDELKAMEQSVIEVSMLMRQVADLVVDQDVKFTSIEDSTQRTETMLEEGVKELQIAKVSAAAARHKRKLCFGFFALIVVIVVIVIAVQFRGSSSKGDSTPEAAHASSAL